MRVRDVCHETHPITNRYDVRYEPAYRLLCRWKTTQNKFVNSERLSHTAIEINARVQHVAPERSWFAPPERGTHG